MVKDAGKVVGYILGTTDRGQFYKDFLIKRAWSATVVFFPKLLSRQRLKKALETLVYPMKKQPGKSNQPKAELFDMAILRLHHGSGIAQELFSKFVNQCVERQVSSFRIPTSASLERAHRFYAKAGARRVGVVEVHSGQPTYIYQFDIEE